MSKEVVGGVVEALPKFIIVHRSGAGDAVVGGESDLKRAKKVAPAKGALHGKAGDKFAVYRLEASFTAKPTSSLILEEDEEETPPTPATDPAAATPSPDGEPSGDSE